MIRFAFTIIIALICAVIGIEAVQTPGWLFAVIGGALITLAVAIPLHDLFWPEDTSMGDEQGVDVGRAPDEHAQWYGCDRL